jgi:small nuclear ribonucleoprotein G
MPAASAPELKKYLDKRMSLQLNGARLVTGVLRGFDPFMNIVLDDCVEVVSSTEKHNIGMVVSLSGVLIEIGYPWE